MKKTVKQNIAQPVAILTPEQEQMQVYIQKLDAIVSKHEAHWGIGRIEEGLQQHFPDLLEKWLRQKEKVNAAITGNDITSMDGLVDSSGRALVMFDEKLKGVGYKPYEPEYWAVDIDGVTYVVCNNYKDVQAMHKPAERHGCVLLTLEELLRCYITRHGSVYGTATTTPEEYRDKKPPVDFKNGGDAMPF